MTAPTFQTIADARWGHRQIIRFGGLPRADTGVVQPYIDLNDADSWWAEDIQIDGRHISNKATQLNWRGKGVWTAQDFVGRKITIPAKFDEGNSHNMGYPEAKGVMTMAGEQYLTFDNLTGMRVRLNSFSLAKPVTPHAPYLWDAPLEFLSRNPFAEDLGGSVVAGPFAMGSVPGGLGFTGAYTAQDINYLGHAYGEPVVTISMPGGGATISTVYVNNWTYNPTMYIAITNSFLQGGGHTIVFSSELFTTVIDFTQFAPTGTFPFLFPGINNIGIAVAANSDLGGAGLHATITYANKYEI
jgi:hypothetical protein